MEPELLLAKQKFILSRSVKDFDVIKQEILINGGELDDKTISEESVDAIVVLDEFKGEEFRRLYEEGRRIIGTRCLNDSIKKRKPLPKSKYPVYSRLLEHKVVCVSSFEKKRDREEIKTLVRYMAGKFSKGIHNNVDYLISPKVGSIKYKVAVKNNIEVVTPNWISDIWEKQKLLETKKYKLPPFAGLVISVTGLSAGTRNEIQRLAKAYGGVYTPNLTKKCTHLLSESPQGLKYRYALEWGIYCVTTQWFFDSINYQTCSDETKHFHPLSDYQRERLFNPLCSSRDLNRLSPALRRKHLLALRRKYTKRQNGSSSFRGNNEHSLFNLTPRLSSRRNSSGTTNNENNINNNNNSNSKSSSASKNNNNHNTNNNNNNNNHTSNNQKNSIYQSISVNHSSDSQPQGILINDVSVVLKNLNNTIDYYKELMKKQDCSDLVDNFLRDKFSVGEKRKRDDSASPSSQLGLKKRRRIEELEEDTQMTDEEENEDDEDDEDEEECDE